MMVRTQLTPARRHCAATAPALGALLFAVALATPAAAQQGRGGSTASATVTPAAQSAAERALASSAADARRQALSARVAELRYANELRSSGRRATGAQRDSLERLSRTTDTLRERADQLELQLNAMRASRNPRAQATRVYVRTGQPVGWFGVDVQSTVQTSTNARGGILSASSEYPAILAVEPGSPAARAGLMAGDRLVAINGMDLRRQEVDLAALLRPGATVPVRIQRSGTLREVQVAITPRPASFESGVTVRVVQVPEGRIAMFGQGPTQQVMVLDEDGARVARQVATARMAEAQALQRVSVSTSTPVASGTAPGAPVYLFTPSPSRMPLAGAELMALNDEFRAVFGVERGLLVLTTVADLPAARAGLRPGDVIVRAGARTLDSPADLQRLMAQAERGTRVLELELVRQKKKHKVRLRW